jgi:hypothetical protein
VTVTLVTLVTPISTPYRAMPGIYVFPWVFGLDFELQLESLVALESAARGLRGGAGCLGRVRRAWGLRGGWRAASYLAPGCTRHGGFVTGDLQTGLVSLNLARCSSSRVVNGVAFRGLRNGAEFGGRGRL